MAQKFSSLMSFMHDNKGRCEGDLQLWATTPTSTQSLSVPKGITEGHYPIADVGWGAGCSNDAFTVTIVPCGQTTSDKYGDDSGELKVKIYYRASGTDEWKEAGGTEFNSVSHPQRYDGGPVTYRCDAKKISLAFKNKSILNPNGSGTEDATWETDILG
jgi:hypothetical protein